MRCLFCDQPMLYTTEYLPYCCGACEDTHTNIREDDGVYCHTCYGPCLGHGEPAEVTEDDLNNPELYCGGERIG